MKRLRNSIAEGGGWLTFFVAFSAGLFKDVAGYIFGISQTWAVIGAILIGLFVGLGIPLLRLLIGDYLERRKHQRS